MDATLLVATRDADLLDDVLRWSAAVGVAPVVAHDVVEARRSWGSATAVVVGADVAPALARTSPPRRDHVLVLVPGVGSPTGDGAGEGADGWWPAAVGLGAVAVLGPEEEHRVLDLLGAALDGGGEACVVSVVGAVGGSGASVLAAAVATAAAQRGHHALLLDADDRAAGLDLVLGAEHVEGVRWPDLNGAAGHVGSTHLREVLPRRHGVAVLASSRVGEPVPVDAVPDVLAAASRGFDAVVADVPRHLDALGAAVLGRSEGAVLLVPEEVRAVAAARSVLDRVRHHVPLVALVTVARRGGLGGSAVADALQLPVVGRIRPDRGVRRRVDQGRGPGAGRSLRGATGSVLDLLGLDPVTTR